MTTDYKKKEIFYLTMGIKDVNELFEIRGKFSLRDTVIPFDENYSIHLINNTSGDTLDVGYPNKFTGLYSFIVAPGKFRLFYKGAGYITQVVDTAISHDNPVMALNIDVILARDNSKPGISAAPVVYDKINLALIPTIATVDTTMLIRNLNVSDVGDQNINDSDVLYYTVQVMALYNPVDVTYFKYITDMKVMYNDADKFYRYITGRFPSREEAFALRQELIRKGYPEQIFIKKVSK
jgi:hypothetical protein